MSESIFEHTTSIAGLTCKPLSILSETISSQEMSMARGGDDTSGGGSQPGQDPAEHQREQAERQARRTEALKLLDEQKQKDIAGLGPLGGTYIPIVDVSGSLNTTAQVDSSNVDTTAQADSSGTQDQNAGAVWEDIQDDDDDDELSNGFETLWGFETAEPDNTRATPSGG